MSLSIQCPLSQHSFNQASCHGNSIFQLERWITPRGNGAAVIYINSAVMMNFELVAVEVFLQYTKIHSKYKDSEYQN